MLYRAGHVGESVFALRRGLIKETLPADGSDRIVRWVAAGGVTGLAAVLGQAHRHHAIVSGEAEGCRIPVERLHQSVLRDPAALRSLLASWQAVLDDVDRVIGRFANGPAEARLARFVLFLLERQGNRARLRRRDAAELIGVTPVSVTRLIARFKREGLIDERDGRLVAADCERLGLLAREGRVCGQGSGGLEGELCSQGRA